MLFRSVYIKANKINQMSHVDVGPHKTAIYTDNDDNHTLVLDTIDEILEQLENIHPSMR